MILDGKNQINIKRFVVGPLQTNCYIVSEVSSNNAIIIDPGYPDQSVIDYIDNKVLDVKYIVNTHGHADHIAGNSRLGYPVLIHGAEKNYLTNPMLNLSFLAGILIDRSVPAALLKDGDTIDMGAIKFEVIHTPGHSPGGICLLFSDILFSGDTLFFEGIGRSDCPGGDHTELISSIKDKLLVLSDKVKVFPGHGPETTIGHERECNPFY